MVKSRGEHILKTMRLAREGESKKNSASLAEAHLHFANTSVMSRIMNSLTRDFNPISSDP